MELSAAALVAPPTAPSGAEVPRALTGVALAMALAGVLALPACGRELGATTFTPQAINTPTADPFTPSVGTDQVGVIPPPRVNGAYSGATSGLYAGGGLGPVCDATALLKHLEADATKAAAWAHVLGIEPAEIGARLARFTPVALRTDTAVMDHGYTDGSATRVPAVLQAGTAVFVDDRGVPIVKCASGDPLTAAPTNDVTYQRANWAGFAPEAVTTVTPAPAPIDSFVIADPTGTGVRRPIGTSGSVDVPYAPGVDDPPTDGPAASHTDPFRPTADASRPGDQGSDYPLDSPREVTTTYLATAEVADDDGLVSDGCRRAGILAQGFTITLRVHDVGGGRSEITIEGNGAEPDTVAIGAPRPNGDFTDMLSLSGTFSPGGSRVYDTSTHKGVFTARWGGSLGSARPHPDQFPLTIRQTWERDPDFVPWLASSGGPETYSCTVDLVAVRQA